MLLLFFSASGTSASAGVASATGSAHRPIIVHDNNIIAYDPDPSIGGNVSTSSGTGNAYDTTGTTTTGAGVAQGSGSAGNAALSIVLNAEATSATGAAYNATTICATNVNATEAAVAGAAGGTTQNIDANSETTSVTGEAHDATGAAAGQPAGVAQGSASAFDATGTVSVFGNAEVATGTGVAGDATVIEAPNAAVASGTGISSDLSAFVDLNSESALGSGAAYDPLGVTGASALAEVAQGTGSGSGVSPAVDIQAEGTSGTGSASDATVTVSGGSTTDANAGLASSTGTADAATANVGPNAESATAAGVAGAATSNVGPNAEAATAVVAGGDGGGSVVVSVAVAQATGTAYNVPYAGVAQGVVTAHDPSISIAVDSDWAEVLVSVAGTDQSLDLSVATITATGRILTIINRAAPSGSTATRNWRFYDRILNEEYVFEVSPTEMDSLNFSKQIIYQNTLAPERKSVIYEGTDENQEIAWSGTLVSQEQFETFVAWYEKENTVELTDDLGRVWEVYITDMTPKRERNMMFPWKHGYSMRALVVTELPLLV